MKRYVPNFYEFIGEGRNTEARAQAQMDDYTSGDDTYDENVIHCGIDGCIKITHYDDIYQRTHGQQDPVYVKTPFFEGYFENMSNTHEHPDGMFCALHTHQKSFWLSEDGHLYTWDEKFEPNIKVH